MLSGPRRTYVMLLFWQRITDPCAGCGQALARAGAALGNEPAVGGAACEQPCRLLLAVRLHRILWRRLVGLTLLVLHS
ncbi:MAG: hypothetical protein HYU51_15640 [Candidatus Rokubacteria bacterium]|nr:hypothetical protein [Candidatus Rokubacteria bacterium]